MNADNGKLKKETDRALQIKNKTERYGTLLITIIILAIMIIVLKSKGFYIDNKYTAFAALLALVLSVFPFSIVHEYIHYLLYPSTSNRKVVYEFKGIKTTFHVESEAKITKFNALLMLISPSLVLGLIPILISLFINNKEIMTFFAFFGFSSLAMASNDLFYFVVLLIKMKNSEYFYQKEDKIYIQE